MKLHTPTHDPRALRVKLDELLAAPPEKAMLTKAGDACEPSLKERLARRLPWLRSARNAWNAWRLTGWSVRWMVLRLPLVRPVAGTLWAFLTGWRFRRHVTAEIGRLETLLQHAQEQNRRLIEKLSQRQRSLAVAQACQEHSLSSAHHRLARLEAGLGQVEEERKKEIADAFPACYLALENAYRGDSATIEARQAAYLEPIQEAGAGTKDAPVLDLGCGRGEWLALLGKRGLVAIGVDSNPRMAEEAARQGLHVIDSDLLLFLEAAAPASLGAVTAFQVAEHLDTESLLRLLASARRALRPGGVLILETPNPENLQVGAYSFWLDPTHRRPLPPPLLAFYARHFGYCDIRIARANPWSENPRLSENSVAARHIEKILFCEQDYALIARKAHE